MADQLTTKAGGPTRAVPGARPSATMPTAAAPKPGIKWPEIQFRGERVPSTIHKDLSHVIVVAGFYGCGKTTFLIGAEEPENILMFDYESKGVMIANQLGVENYFPIAQEVSEAQGTTE